jgi:hypothetical protein
VTVEEAWEEVKRLTDAAVNMHLRLSLRDELRHLMEKVK